MCDEDCNAQVFVTACGCVQGVCVCAYGTDEFPAFFTRRSGCAAPARVDDPDAAARMVSAALQLDLSSGIVIGSITTFCRVALHPLVTIQRSLTEQRLLQAA